MQIGKHFLHAKKIKLHYRCWIPVCPKALMILIHGAGEHSGQYSHIAAECPHQQIAFVAPDLRGFGHSEGRRGHIRRFRDYIDDLDLLIGHLQAEYPALPAFVVGHSLGGLIALRYVQHHGHKLSGMILISPALDLHASIPKSVKKFLCLASWVAPALPLQLVKWNESFRKLPWFKSHLPDWTSELLKDRLATITYTPRWFRELIHNGSNALSQTNELPIPSLCIYDRHDPVVNSDRIRQLVDSIVSDDKESAVYAAGNHQFLYDREVIQRIFQWLATRV